MAECDSRGNGVYVLELSREKAEELLFSNNDDEVPMEKREIPEDTYSIYIYINNYSIGQEPIGEATVNGNNNRSNLQYNPSTR